MQFLHVLLETSNTVELTGQVEFRPPLWASEMELDPVSLACTAYILHLPTC